MEGFSSKIYYQNFKNPHSHSEVISPLVSSVTGQVYYKSQPVGGSEAKSNRFLSKSLKYKEAFDPTSLVSLRKCCMDYVVKNFHLVDSLEGFPELVAKELFDECCIFGYFQPDSAGNWLKILHVFTDTYGDAMLQSLNLSGRWLFLSLHIDYLTAYESLEFVDFSNCRVGNDHDALSYLGSLTGLKKLYLCNNCISTNGIKLLTQSQRRKSIGLQKLEVLRLDGNPKITLDILPYFRSLEALEIIVVSNSPDIETEDIKFGSQLCGSFSQCPHSVRFHQREWESSAGDVGEGWAVPLIKSYLFDMEESIQRKQSKTNLGKGKGNFYSKPKTVSKSNVDASVVCKNHLIICKCSKNLKTPLLGKRSSQNVALHSNQSKRKCTVNLSKSGADKGKLHIDTNLLDLYR
uniref:Leucine-rich repeat-containing protein 42-like n=1 Tax=Phallusia mammillata TaxID=59560 RepID=A0A6F9DKK9_9ASCI|nr:leucine-rich repeat-containing protein 42-like [Phallusia mammillata]